MKCLFLFIALWTKSVCTAQVKIAVDPRLELSGVVFYLAGAEEYARGHIPQYKEDIDTYFGAYRQHPLICYIRKIRDEYSVSYDAVAFSGLVLQMQGNRLEVDSTAMAGLIRLDERWNKTTLSEYIRLLEAFCAEADFMKFYDEHASFYQTVVEGASKMLQSINQEWFEQFWGNRAQITDLIVSPASGVNNYAIPAGYNLLPAACRGIILGCSHTDAAGVPLFDDQDKGVLIHEMCHHFTNPLYDRRRSLFRPAAERIFPYVQALLNKVGYGSAEVMCGEALNELFVNMYYLQNDPNWMKYRVEWDENNGFIWMSKAIRNMRHFLDNRKKYPRIEDYVPELVHFFNDIAANMESVWADYENRHPVVVSSSPAQNSVIATDTSTIVIRFSVPMFTGVKGAYAVSPEIPAPDITGIEWSDHGTCYVIHTAHLQPDTRYGIRLPYQFFIDNESGHRLEADYVLIFSTTHK